MARVSPEQVHVLRERIEGARPTTRGRIHQVAALLTPVVAVPVLVAADPGLPRLGAGVFLASLFVLFATSASYHRIDWSPRWALRMKRADHVAIFVLVAGTYTPVALVVLDGWQRASVLAVSWTAVAIASVASAFGVFERRGVAITAYIALGWMAVLMAPDLLDELSVGTLVLIVVGGVIYTVGAIGLARRWPDPDPARFGYHEVWHLNTVLGAIAHGVAVVRIVS